MIRENLAGIRARMEASCGRSGRRTSDITLVAVTKNVPVQSIAEAVKLGITDLGESKVQEALVKIPSIPSPSSQLNWHMIGHLQSNKAKRACEMFGIIQSLDSEKLASSIDRYAGELNKKQDCLIEVKVSDEVTKTGIAYGQVSSLFDFCGALKNIRVAGLMCIAPYFENADHARPHFAKARKLFDQIFNSSSLKGSAPILSMGMSHDFEAAIEEGSTMVRIGTAIFGRRQYQ